MKHVVRNTILILQNKSLISRFYYFSSLLFFLILVHRMNFKWKSNIPYKRLINKSSYDSVEGNMLFEYFNDNPILKTVIFNTTYMANNVEECIHFCLKQSQLESLIFYTDQLDNFPYANTVNSPLTRLKFLCVASKFDVNDLNDYILPFLRNAPNLEYIFYTNGSLSNESIQILREMIERNLVFLHLDTVHIQDPIFFRKTSKKFDKIFWLLRQRYISSEVRVPNFLISAWKRIFHR